MSDQICDTTIQKYLQTLQEGFDVHSVEDRCIIATPFLYPDFASIEFTIQPIGDGYLLSDEGETLNMLFLNGLSVEENRELLKYAIDVARNYGVELDKSNISIVANDNNIGEASQNLLNAIQAIGFFIYKRRNIIHATFDDEVEKVFIENEVKERFKLLASR